MPAAAHDGDQAGISNGAGPVDPVAFEVSPEIERARIAIDGGTMQRDKDFDAVAAAKIQGFE